jgi:hypothetical protein
VKTATHGMRKLLSIHFSCSFQCCKIKRAFRRLEFKSPKRFLPCFPARAYHASASAQSPQIKAASPSVTSFQYESPLGSATSFKHCSRTLLASSHARSFSPMRKLIVAALIPDQEPPLLRYASPYVLAARFKKCVRCAGVVAVAARSL